MFDVELVELNKYIVERDVALELEEIFMTVVDIELLQYKHLNTRYDSALISIMLKYRGGSIMT